MLMVCRRLAHGTRTVFILEAPKSSKYNLYSVFKCKQSRVRETEWLLDNATYHRNESAQRLRGRRTCSGPAADRPRATMSSAVTVVLDDLDVDANDRLAIHLSFPAIITYKLEEYYFKVYAQGLISSYKKPHASKRLKTHTVPSCSTPNHLVVDLSCGSVTLRISFEVYAQISEINRDSCRRRSMKFVGRFEGMIYAAVLKLTYVRRTTYLSHVQLNRTHLPSLKHDMA